MPGAPWARPRGQIVACADAGRQGEGNAVGVAVEGVCVSSGAAGADGDWGAGGSNGRAARITGGSAVGEAGCGEGTPVGVAVGGGGGGPGATDGLCSGVGDGGSGLGVGMGETRATGTARSRLTIERAGLATLANTISGVPSGAGEGGVEDSGASTAWTMAGATTSEGPPNESRTASVAIAEPTTSAATEAAIASGAPEIPPPAMPAPATAPPVAAAPAEAPAALPAATEIPSVRATFGRRLTPNGITARALKTDSGETIFNCSCWQVGHRRCAVRSLSARRA